VGACPGDDESAGVNYTHRSPKGNRNMRRILNQSANAAVKAKGSIFEIVVLTSLCSAFSSLQKSCLSGESCAVFKPVIDLLASFPGCIKNLRYWNE
jgi:hypothetical protein